MADEKEEIVELDNADDFFDKAQDCSSDEASTPTNPTPLISNVVRIRYDNIQLTPHS